MLKYLKQCWDEFWSKFGILDEDDWTVTDWEEFEQRMESLKDNNK